MAIALASLLTVREVEATEGVAPQPAREGPGGNLDLARSVAVTGREAFNAGDYETALALFRRAYTLFPAPTLVLYEARTLEKMGLLLEALQAYARTAQMPVDAESPAQFAEAIAAARQERVELEASVPSLTLKVEGAGPDEPNLEVSINGRAIGVAQLGQAQLQNPGTYRVSGSVGSARTDESVVALKKGQHLIVVLQLGSASRQPDEVNDIAATGSASSLGRPIPLLAYAAGGVGALGMGVGLVTGLMANGKHSEAESECLNRECLSGSRGAAAVDAFRTLRMVSTVSYGVGAVGLGAAVVLWLTGTDGSESGRVSSIEPWGTVDTAGVRGTF